MGPSWRATPAEIGPGWAGRVTPGPARATGPRRCPPGAIIGRHPYLESTVSDHLTPDAIAALLLASAHAVAAEASALGARARVRPRDGEWCANEIVGHLIEAERRGFNGRIRAILAPAEGEPEPALVGWDQPAVAAARRDELKETTDLLAELADLRADSLALVRGLGPADLGRRGLHPRVGPLAVDDIVHEWVHHDREHLVQLLEVSRTFAWAGMGAARRFSDPSA